MMSPDDTVLIVIDIQGKLAQLMHEKERLFENASRMIRGAAALKLPIIWAEQYPKGLGPTLDVIAAELGDRVPVPKMSFSCCGEGELVKQLDEAGRAKALLVGIETHVCVYQTATDLLERGYEVYVVADAVSSRVLESREIALQRLRDEGAKLTCVEMALFEMMRTAEHESFRDVVRIVK